MLVLLPPSETKAAGGDGPPLDLDALSCPELTPTRRKLAEALRSLADDVPASLSALGLSPRQSGEVERNAALFDSPTAPALERYTGVLFDALDVASLPAAERARADARLAVASALFGLVRGGDPIPAYRLSAGSSMPGFGTLRGVWRPVLEPVLGESGQLVVDLRSGAYAALARVPGAVDVQVLAENARGERKVVSHHNKSHKGRLARVLAATLDEPTSVHDVIDLARRADMRVEHPSETSLTIVLPA
ncbi:peroxide stress protein YaaA [Saccharopolyspora sp. NFXS83]|uniref:peroxide stress protein YaaA n=1 Tax=Saccharopolyspora sp. NFXS83 TaxID=2993560 RepID=UPI00224AB753|nr:peroxide stress protein YaaA [Saccharopolyspora sp. NFXS83]MCX2732966.1 peroxide stress protein YaaA [Saccharopolyspora sp. NFXS83]